MNRYWRTVRHLSPGQVVSRIGLRLRAVADRARPVAAAARALRRAGPVPAAVRVPRGPLALLRACDETVVEQTAREIAGGTFEFLGERRDLGATPFPAPADASLLWAYHLEYMDYLLDLCMAGESKLAGRLIRARWVTEGTARLEATHPYPESRRAAAWLRVLDLLDEDDRALAAKGAWVWANRVARHLERDVGGNHLLENGLALALAGATFRGSRARRLRRIGRGILIAGLRDQVLADGGHYELSPMYHARVLLVLLEGGLALENLGPPLPLFYWDTLAKMASFLEAVVDPEGEIPLLGDSAREAGFRPDRFLAAARDALPVPVPVTPPGDRAFPDSGLYRFEDRACGHRLLLDAGRVCPDRLPAHGQADTFSYELHIGGRPFVVDAGLCEYASGPMREWCRSTRSHSTVSVDGEDSAEVWASFRVGRRAHVRDARWSVLDGRATFSGHHDGYAHRGVVHARSVAHLAEGLWLVADRLAGREHHAFASRIHLHPDAKATEGGDGTVTIRHADRVLSVVPFGAGRTSFEDGWHCPGFGERRESRILRLDAVGSRARCGYVLADGDGPVPTVTRSGRVIRVVRGDDSFTRELP